MATTTYTTGPITDACTVTATFEINAYTVTADAGPGGSISPSGTTTVNHGATPAFTVTPNSGYHIKSVNGTCGGSLNGNTYTTNPVTGNCTVHAEFEPNEYTVSASAGQGGRIDPGSAKVTHGNTVQFTITPDTGYHLLYAGGCNGTVSQSSLNAAAKKKKKGKAKAVATTTYTTGPITDACTVTATFEINAYTVTADAGSGGSISPSGAITVNHGATPAFTVTPDVRIPHQISKRHMRRVAERQHLYDKSRNRELYGTCRIRAQRVYGVSVGRAGRQNRPGEREGDAWQYGRSSRSLLIQAIIFHQ